jgi:hypothetical protein
MFIEIPYIKRKLRGLCLRVLNSIENSGDASFDNNGEALFIKNLFNKFKAVNKNIIVFDIGANVGGVCRYD